MPTDVPLTSAALLDVLFEMEEDDSDVEMSQDQENMLLDANGQNIHTDPAILLLREENNRLRENTVCRICRQRTVSLTRLFYVHLFKLLYIHGNCEIILPVPMNSKIKFKK